MAMLYKRFCLGFALLLGFVAIGQKKGTTEAVYLNEYRKDLFKKGFADTADYLLKRKQERDAVLALSMPVKLFTDRLDDLNNIAQQVALSDSFFTKYVFDKNTRKPLWNEIFGVYPARPGDIRKGMKVLPGTARRVEMYNYAYNLTTVALVDIFSLKVLSIDHFPQTQPDLPPSLIQLAVQIAIDAPEVTKALGFKPSATAPVMASTKTALNRTRCERSQHLCVAPTFIQGNRALWAIVDLTDNRVVGLRWTNTSKEVAQPVVTERKIQNENIADCYCNRVNVLKQKGWEMDYLLTSSDGLQISNVRYKGQTIINSAKLVDWHVSYSGTDGFGYSDAVGCPIFSEAAVVATEPPQVAEIMEADTVAGFMLEQKFFSELWPGPCNYSYSQRYFFYTDGRFRMSCASIGRGCGNNGTYRPVFRIGFAGNNQVFSEWDNNKWAIWHEEGWKLQDATTAYYNDKYQFKLNTGLNRGYFIEPGRGQFNDGGRGDNAYLYVTKNHLDKNEGETDLVTIGPCCNTDYKQGPEKFMEPIKENIQNTDLILWYVPQLKNDDTPTSKYCWAETYYENGQYKVKTYPCFAGPMFVPFNK
jgi:hypothetical protein